MATWQTPSSCHPEAIVILTGNGTTLLGLVTDGGGDSSKAKNMSDIYHSGLWIVPGH